MNRKKEIKISNYDILSQFSLDGRIALVTGGSGGIGHACVKRLLDYGAKVTLTYIKGTETPEMVLEKFTDVDGITIQPLNLNDINSIKNCINGVVQQHGQIDILVNNAAVGSATVSEFSDDPETQDSVMLDINAEGTLKMCQQFLALPDMPNRKLINISSVGGGIAAFPGFRLSDGMSKAAVAVLTRQLAAETVHSAVDVFAVCPGATNTEMFEASTLSKLSLSERKRFLLNLPKKRLIEPEEIATIVHFLSCSLSSVLHGSVIDASMGLGVRPGLMSEYS